MAKTYEALKKAERGHQLQPEETKALNIRRKPQNRPLVSFNIATPIREEYHHMKNTVLRALPGKPNKTLLFASATEGEGASSVLTNFAITLAAEGDKVLLIDANLRNPVLHDLLSLDPKNGLAELILEARPLHEVIKPTKLTNLSVITAGVLHANPFRLFESNILDDLIGRMKHQAEWILFDTPPIISSDDSIMLASKMDGVIMVLQAEKSRWEVARSARERIEAGQGDILGIVLNRRRMYIPNWAYKML